jgi:hypothetical protein
LVSCQLPDYLLLLSFAGLGGPLAPFELMLQFGPKRLLPRHHCLRFHNGKSRPSRQDPYFLTPDSGRRTLSLQKSPDLYAIVRQQTRIGLMKSAEKIIKLIHQTA